MKIIGNIVLICTLFNTVRLITKNSDTSSVLALIGLLLFAIIGIIYTFFIN